MKKFLLAIFILPTISFAQPLVPPLSSLVTLWLQQAGKHPQRGDWSTGEVNGGPDQILTWNDVVLGAQPTQDQLQSMIPAWQASQDADLIPKQVTRAQALASLSDAGLLDTIQSAVAANPDPHVAIFWANTQTFERASPTIASIGASVGLTSAQIDALFIAAAKIRL